MTEVTSKAARKAARPLSPHLQVYRPGVNMVMSIVHRITGAALYLGTLLLAWWLVAAAAGPEAYAVAREFFGSVLGQIILFGYTWALMQHMLGGMRHLIWDTGHGFDLKTVDAMSWGGLAASIVLTALIWIAAAPWKLW